ncbi:MAG: LysR family transcriptional regulator, partial [Pseudomonadota bacterium]
MTLDQLKTFLYVARLGGVRRAAQELNLSQPAVSARLLALETSLGASLLNRTPRGVSLTNEGALLVQLAEQLVFVHDEIRARLGDPAAAGGLIRIGAAETIAQSWLPTFVEAISADLPQAIVDLTVDISVNLREGLLARQLDLALLMGPVSHFEVENIALPEVPLTWLRQPGD